MKEMVDQVDNLKKKKKKKKNKQKEDGEKVKRVTGSFFNKQLFYRVDIHFFLPTLQRLVIARTK